MLDTDFSSMPPKMMGKRVAFDLSLETLPLAIHTLLRNVGSPKRQVHREKDGQHGLQSFQSTNMRRKMWRAAVASKLVGS